MRTRRLPENLTIPRICELVPFFQDLPENSLTNIANHFVAMSYGSNQSLLVENDLGGSVYFILQGWVKIRTHNQEGKELTLNLLGKNEIFGEMAAISDLPRSCDALSMTPATLGRIPAADFVNLINTHPLCGVRLVKLMANRLRQVNRRLQLREASSAARVADALLFLVEGQGAEGENGLEIPSFPHREISSLSGLARETVTRVLGKFEKKNIIQRQENLIIIPNKSDLESLLLQ